MLSSRRVVLFPISTPLSSPQKQGRERRASLRYVPLHLFHEFVIDPLGFAGGLDVCFFFIFSVLCIIAIFYILLNLFALYLAFWKLYLSTPQRLALIPRNCLVSSKLSRCLAFVADMLWMQKPNTYLLGWINTTWYPMFNLDYALIVYDFVVPA